jgi:hypothetical protein
MSVHSVVCTLSIYLDGLLLQVDSSVDSNLPDPSSPRDNVRVGAGLAVQELPDISQLDIKSSVSSLKSHEEFDFFQDMEPVISKTCILQIDEQGTGSTEISSKHRFDVNYTAGESEGEVWGDDLEDWGDVNGST